nr:retrovirus-related Pol polyprotein from transposon TNT 1-94 [Tanacetum cinerariifolium]
MAYWSFLDTAYWILFPSWPLEEAVQKELAIDIYKRFSILEEERPVIETMAYSDKYKKILDEIVIDKLKLDGKIKKENEKAIKQVKREALQEKNDLGAILNTRDRITSTFDEVCRQTFRAAKTSLNTKESNSDDEEDYDIQRNSVGALIYRPKLAKYLNYMLEVRVNEMRSVELLFTFEAWKRAFDISEPIYTELCHDFYATFEFDEAVVDDELMTKKTIKFRLCGKAYAMSILDFSKRLVRFGNDQFAPILGYGDLVQGNVTIKRVYYVKGMNHNLFSVGQFFDANLEVAFRKSTCYVRDLKGNDLLTGSCGSDLYSITIQETTSPNPICLMVKATLSQAWLWHRRLSHLYLKTVNLLSKNEFVSGLPKLKFVKYHLCSSCKLGKAKRKSFKTKTTPSSKIRLQLLHMDLCGPMRVESINGKKYVLVIVDDYSRYTWTHFLRPKDETPGVLIDFLRFI